MGTGGGVGGCTPPLSRKFARHPAGKKQGGGAPRGAKHPGEKKFWPPGEAIFWDFWAKSPPGLLNKPATEKNFSPPGGGAGEKFSGRRRRPENFFKDTPRCRPPPLSQNPCPPMIIKDQQASYKKFYYRKYNIFITPLSWRFCFGVIRGYRKRLSIFHEKTRGFRGTTGWGL